MWMIVQRRAVQWENCTDEVQYRKRILQEKSSTAKDCTARRREVQMEDCTELEKYRWRIVQKKGSTGIGFYRRREVEMKDCT